MDDPDPADGDASPIAPGAADDREASDGDERRGVRLRATGHEHVTAAHDSTLEVTSDDWLTPAGDCIVGVAATRTPAEFPAAFVTACQDREAHITLVLEADGHRATVTGRGHPALTFDDDRSLVCRTSEYVDDRTVMIDADAAAGDLDRSLVATLADGAALRVALHVHVRNGD